MSHSLNRRFIGTRTLYEKSFDAFVNAHVYIIGVGGVGSWAVEALARTGIGALTLVDLDVLVESNVNRQLPALTQTFGISKIEEMANRAKNINPDINIFLVDDFLNSNNVQDILPNKQTIMQLRQQNKSIIVLDCTDDIQAKLAIALHCRFNKIKLIISGGAGGKIDPTKIGVADLKEVTHDPLLAKLRQNLKDKNINKDLKNKFAMKCVYSNEPIKMANACESGLNCGGYGSAVTVTATVGMIMASECLKMIADLTKDT